MSMSNAAEAALQDLIWLNVAWPNVGDASGLQPSAVAGSFYIALHSTDPTEGGNQTSSEIAYTGYARVAVPRSGAGFSRSVSTISNVATVQFGECTAGSATAQYFSVGLAPSGAGVVLVSGILSNQRSISSGITPLFNPGTLQAVAD